MKHQPLFEKHPRPWQCYDEGDGETSVLDATKEFVFMDDDTLTFQQWLELLAVVNGIASVEEKP